MLLKKATLEGIKAGDIELVFRKWRRPTVKKGGTLLTRVGQLRILDIKQIDFSQISDANFCAAGIHNRSLWAEKMSGREGELYQIRLKWEGEDPRIALRNQIVKQEDFASIFQKLNKMDARSTKGPWSFRVLHLIRKHPGRLAKLLADEMEVEKAWLKPNIRKLKAMGLTISLEVGYQLSARGRSFMDRLDTIKE